MELKFKKQKNKFQNKKLKNIALGNIFLLVISIVAFGYILGSEIGVVSAKEIIFTSGGVKYKAYNVDGGVKVQEYNPDGNTLSKNYYIFGNQGVTPYGNGITNDLVRGKYVDISSVVEGTQDVGLIKRSFGGSILSVDNIPYITPAPAAQSPAAPAPPPSAPAPVKKVISPPSVPGPKTVKIDPKTIEEVNIANALIVTQNVDSDNGKKFCAGGGFFPRECFDEQEKAEAHIKSIQDS